MAVVINGSTGIATPDGTAGVPSHTGTSGSTNGLYFPTATSAAISTNGLQAIAIDSSQNVTHTAATTFVGNLTFSGASARFLGDFTNATVSTRLSFQTSTTNGTTGIYALPNGTSTAASWQATNAADPTNASKILIATNGSTDVQLVSGRNGTGTYLPLSFYTNGTQNAQLDTSGNLTTVGTVNMGSTFKRNFIINGDMRVNQRGAASYTATGYTVDRFYLYNNTQPYAAPSTSSPPSGFTNYLKVGRQSGATNTGTVNFNQVLETLNSTPLAGQTVTLSFYAKAGANFSAASNTIVVAVNSGTGTDQSAASFGAWTGNAAVTSGSPSLTTSWVRYTYTGTVSSSATQIGMLIYFTPVGTAGADDTFYITGVQLEVGSIATPYERQIYSEQLAQCQRYYLQTATTTNSVPTFYAYVVNGVTIGVTSMFPVAMRIAPTATVNGTWATAGTAATAPSIGGLTTLGYLAYIVGNSGTAVSTYFQPNGSGYVAFNSEL